MADGRMIKKRISKSIKFSKLRFEESRTLYLMLMPHLDVEGRYEANAHIIKGYIVPLLKSFTYRNIHKFLNDLQRVGLVVLYNHNGQEYLEAVRFDDFQKLRKDREAPSEIPAPPESLRSYSGVDRENSGLREVKLSKDKLREGKGALSRFSPPDQKEVFEYMQSLNGSYACDYGIESHKFCDHFTSNGWKVGGKGAMKDWKASVRNWLRRAPETGGVKTMPKKKSKPNPKCDVCCGSGKLPDNGLKCWCWS